MKLSKLIKQENFASSAQEAILNVMVTNAWLVGEMSSRMMPYGVTAVQYNVLRILRGSHPEKLTCSEIGERMLDRTPDVTRLLNRLERVDLVERERAEHDRRVVHVGISARGLELLEKMACDVEEIQNRLARHLTDHELKNLSLLLEKLRTDQ